MRKRISKNIAFANRHMRDGFSAAYAGFQETLRHERSFKVMCTIGVAVIGAMFYFPTSTIEKLALVAMVFSILILELLNGTIERILDFMSPEYDERVRTIKDLMAAIVLLASVGAAVCGTVIFYPYLM